VHWLTPKGSLTRTLLPSLQHNRKQVNYELYSRLLDLLEERRLELRKQRLARWGAVQVACSCDPTRESAWFKTLARMK
jgi:hypothetical protein